MSMNRNMINDKINFFIKSQTKVHLKKIPSRNFPKGKFHNGIIVEKYDNVILFNDPITNSLAPIHIFISEIDDIEEFILPSKRGVVEEDGN